MVDPRLYQLGTFHDLSLSPVVIREVLDTATKRWDTSSFLEEYVPKAVAWRDIRFLIAQIRILIEEIERINGHQ